LKPASGVESPTSAVTQRSPAGSSRASARKLGLSLTLSSSSSSSMSTPATSRCSTESMSSLRIDTCLRKKNDGVGLKSGSVAR
jgi:hypothetical protein